MKFEETPKQFHDWFTETISVSPYEDDWLPWFDCWKEGYYVGLNDSDHKILE